MDTMISLSVGEEHHLGRGKDRIIYAGMPYENVYSIVQKKASGYQGFAWSLFFSLKKQDIVIDGIRVLVEKATPEEIRFTTQ